jgi:hypothetical protein
MELTAHAIQASKGPHSQVQPSGDSGIAERLGSAARLLVD